MKQWFNKLNKWTDRQPLAGLLVVAALCLCGIVLCFELETVIARQGVASFVSGVLTGMLLTSVFHVIDVTAKRSKSNIRDAYELAGLKGLREVTPSDDPLAKPLLESRIKELEKKTQKGNQ